jgi:hypothetical protein
MSDKELEMLEQDDEQITAVDQQEENIEEAKASFGVDAEVPDPKAKKATAPGGEAQQGDKSGAPAQGSSMPKTKVALITAMSNMLAGMDKSSLMATYKGMSGMKEEAEEDTSVTSIKEIKKVSSDDVNVAEEFVSKATTIFEAAVVSKVNEILETVTIDMEAELEAEKAEIVEGLSTKLDDYLEYVVEEWMKDNELAVEQGIRAEIAENFMKGLKDLFTENYIDVPEEKVDLVDELANKVTELESSVNEEVEKNIQVRKELVSAKKNIALGTVCEGLTDSQVEKMKSLSEGVEFESDEDYMKKLETLKSNYFPQEEVIAEDASIDEEPLEIDDDGVSVGEKPTPEMSAYMDAISRSVKK